MKVTVFSTQAFEGSFLQHANNDRHELALLADSLRPDTAHLAQGALAVSVFSPDDASEPVLEQLSAQGVRYVAVRAAGYDNVDLRAAQRLGMRVANVPEYS
ncbi:MAG: 2-hydroxyacid dehydrogenase, partial [Hymenobacter sp.]|nr:2-hydroxyacid dehydrogenase [Hymenobacter sp.]